jgi:AGCS family alanine or glycine:cation symporter
VSGIDATVEALVRPLADAIAAVVFFPLPLAGAEVPLVVLWLVVGALFFTLRFRFISVRGFRHALRLVWRPLDGRSSGEVSHFHALSTAVSGTVGIGNIGGVAVAVSVGGPGAAFWLVVAGLLAMSTKFVECSLGVIYRRENPGGSVSGGPMYYLERGLGERGWARLGRGLGVFYAIGIVIGCLGIGNMFQSNQAFVQIVGVTGGASSPFAERGWLVGGVLAVTVGVVVLGGIRSIVRVTARLVPIMAVLYLVSAFVVIALNAQALPWALGQMVGSAFTPGAAGGGALGAMVVGFQRALFSNEAGIGSATIAHSAVQTDEPLTEGFVSLLEPFLDTIVICQATALVIITTTYFEPGFAVGLGGIEITSAAFERLAPWAPVPLAVAATLFAFSTMIAWSYYGLKGVTYLVGESRRAENLFRIVFCAFVAVGCMVQLEAILDFSDALVFLICVPNLIGLYVLAPVVRARLRAYADAAPEERPGP